MNAEQAYSEMHRLCKDWLTTEHHSKEYRTALRSVMAKCNAEIHAIQQRRQRDQAKRPT